MIASRTLRFPAALAAFVLAAGSVAGATGFSATGADGHSVCSPGAICYMGRWQFVRSRSDGRFAGRSARSFHSGDDVSFAFTGSRVRIYGITGPTGGRARFYFANEPAQTIDFYSPVRRVHALIYTSKPLDTGRHFAFLVVDAHRNAKSRGNYVNVDQIEASS